ncbi:maestro heat-like repeat-containing protein family member 6 [Heliangelus exortis]|uniref:maestro heat-like repeat-containing protein family member 6 n=1 Tax=Heliangelus exortis TaxID=472823 RepID=UPI003A8FAABA
MSAPERSQVDQEGSSGCQESTQPGAGAGAGAESGAGAWPVRMQQGNTWRNVTAPCGLSTGSLDPDPEGSGSLQAAQEPPSPGDPWPGHEEPTPDLSLPPHSPLGPTGSPHRQCSLEASSTATPIPTPQGLSSSPRSEERASPLSHPHGLSSFPKEQGPPSQPQLAKAGEEGGSHPPTTSELYKAQLLETDSESASSTYLTCSSAEEEEDELIFLDTVEETGEDDLSDMEKQLRELGPHSCSYTLSEQLLQEQLIQDLVFFIDSPRAPLGREVQSGTRPSFHRAHEVLRCIHSAVEHVCSEPARHSLRSLLRVLAERFPEDTVRSLLRISPHCDSAAVAMWEAMLSPLSSMQRIFEGLLRVIQGSAPEEHVSAASRVLRRLSQSPRCQGSLEVLFPRLLMALLNQLARAAQTLLDEPPEGDQRSPLGEAVEAIKDLLCLAGCRENVQQMQEEGIWDMMLQGDTLEAGVSLLAREMCRSSGFVRFSLFLHMRDIVNCGREQENTFAMAFYVELLGCQDVAKTSGDLRLLRSYLDCGSDRMLLLAVRGLVAVAQHPKMVSKA